MFTLALGFYILVKFAGVGSVCLGVLPCSSVVQLILTSHDPFHQRYVLQFHYKLSPILDLQYLKASKATLTRGISRSGFAPHTPGPYLPCASLPKQKRRLPGIHSPCKSNFESKLSHLYVEAVSRLVCLL